MSLGKLLKCQSKCMTLWNYINISVLSSNLMFLWRRKIWAKIQFNLICHSGTFLWTQIELKLGYVPNFELRTILKFNKAAKMKCHHSMTYCALIGQNDSNLSSNSSIAALQRLWREKMKISIGYFEHYIRFINFDTTKSGVL